MKNEKTLNEKLLKDAQYRKGLSIAFFNATNCATEMVKAEGKITKKRFIKWRDWFLAEHTKYYAETIAKVGVAYDPQDAIQKLKKTSNLDELKGAWIGLSEDERRDAEVIGVKKQLKEKYEEI